MNPSLSTNIQWFSSKKSSTYSNEYASDKPKKQKCKKDSPFLPFSTFLTTGPPQFYSYIVFIYLF